MFDQKIAGIMLRRERLLRNWSQETLSKGICSVSYLSKIEQGKADADEQLLAALFEKLEITWQEISQEESAQHCEFLCVFQLILITSYRQGHVRQTL